MQIWQTDAGSSSWRLNFSKCLLGVSSSCTNVRADFLFCGPSAYRCLLFHLLFSLGIPVWEVPPTCLRGGFIIISSACRLSVKGQTPGRRPAVVWRPSALWWTSRLSWISLKHHRGGKCDVGVIRRISPPRLSHQTPMFIKYIEQSSCYGPWCRSLRHRPGRQQRSESGSIQTAVWSWTLHKQALTFRQNTGKDLYSSCLLTWASVLTLFDLFPVVKGV